MVNQTNNFFQEEAAMSKISVVYWSQTGNTEAMAEAVGAGIAKAGKEADVVEVSSASMEDLKAAKVFALGCPARWRWNHLWKK